MDNKIRRVEPDVVFQQKNISKSLLPYLESLEIIDNLEGTLDSLKIVLQNKDNIFLRDGWAFKKGDVLSVGIKTLNWETATEGIKEAGTGIFYVDERELDKESATIKAISSPLKAKDTGNSKTWGTVTLKRLGEEFAKKYELEFQYLVKEKITLSNLTQKKQTDFSFLKKVAEDEGIKLKLTFNKLVLFDEEEFTTRESLTTLDLNKVQDYRIVDKSSEIYDAVQVTRLNVVQLKEEAVVITESELRGKGVGTKNKILKLTGQGRSGDLKKYALKKLEQANKREAELQITDIGNRNIYAGCIFTIINSGEFNGKYIVTQVTKSLPNFIMKISSYKIKEKEGEK